MGDYNIIQWYFKMSTRCQIAIEDANGTVRSVYCHHDGYVTGVGAILVQSYSTSEKVEQLLALGSLSSVGELLQQIQNEVVAVLLHIPHPSGCVAYHRDRGEDYRPPQKWNSADEMADYVLKNFLGDYVYLFRNGDWYVKSCSKPSEWNSVAEILLEMKNEENR